MKPTLKHNKHYKFQTDWFVIDKIHVSSSLSSFFFSFLKNQRVQHCYSLTNLQQYQKRAVRSHSSTGCICHPSLNVYIHYCVPSRYLWGFRAWCCGELKKAGTGRCRSAEAAAEPTLEAGTSRWWPAPRRSEPAGRSRLGHQTAPPLWRSEASYPILETLQCLPSSGVTKK